MHYINFLIFYFFNEKLVLINWKVFEIITMNKRWLKLITLTRSRAFPRQKSQCSALLLSHCHCPGKQCLLVCVSIATNWYTKEIIMPKTLVSQENEISKMNNAVTSQNLIVLIVRSTSIMRKISAVERFDATTLLGLFWRQTLKFHKT